jgi:hypothetical protein
MDVANFSFGVDAALLQSGFALPLFRHHPVAAANSRLPPDSVATTLSGLITATKDVLACRQDVVIAMAGLDYAAGYSLLGIRHRNPILPQSNASKKEERAPSSPAATLFY